MRTRSQANAPAPRVDTVRLHETRRLVATPERTGRGGLPATGPFVNIGFRFQTFVSIFTLVVTLLSELYTTRGHTHPVKLSVCRRTRTTFFTRRRPCVCIEIHCLQKNTYNKTQSTVSKSFYTRPLNATDPMSVS